ncbi:GNAT family N-acetyltransferase [Lentzea sp. BCCO 10_0856]|uniref:GNAT family N-acetyltransferase n=1 Tax=Lentzea miocenica TaxID=3095431 RepID=A0ABU4TA29_9PSEU|nr:GNAT family N-acetyltransferase [Lentzea sp. BCCO 10_0856]MDX8034960.1 GNAT family N-acetyltransferase [Lentzea sp. BCCO 10_0856]
MLGAAGYVVLDNPACAEIALVVSHAEQAHGVGTLLLEHLASSARGRGVRRFTADRVDLGLELCGLLGAVAEREAEADVSSLAHVPRRCVSPLPEPLRSPLPGGGRQDRRHPSTAGRPVPGTTGRSR